MTEEEIKKAEKINFSYCQIHSDIREKDYGIVNYSFRQGVKWALNHQWISVKDKLPSEDDDYVLCHLVNSGKIVSGYIGKGNKVETNPTFEFDAMGDYICDYWMPIPKLKEE